MYTTHPCAINSAELFIIMYVWTLDSNLDPCVHNDVLKIEIQYF